MANIKASKKDLRKSRKRREQNLQKKSRLRTFDKKIQTLLGQGNTAEATEVFKTFASYLDRAGKINLIHHRAADRKKSRIASMIHKVAVASKSA